MDRVARGDLESDGYPTYRLLGQSEEKRKKTPHERMRQRSL